MEIYHPSLTRATFRPATSTTASPCSRKASSLPYSSGPRALALASGSSQPLSWAAVAGSARKGHLAGYWYLAAASAT
jgi:hypothetical protein